MPAASRASESTSSSVRSGVAGSDAGVSAAFRSPCDASGGPAFDAESIAPASLEKPDDPGVAAAAGPVSTPALGGAVGAGTPAAAGLGAGTPAAAGLGGGTPAAAGLGAGAPAAAGLGAGTPAAAGLGAGTPAAAGLGAGTPAA